MTTLLQLSDTHIVAEGELVSGRLDTNAPLERLIQRLQEVGAGRNGRCCAGHR